ncbi:hypothetical protein PIB30_054065 [Stylosanthes scabra]|uniref:Uncharacterized protein n=1 Tax=Stylosanthes scabra TaxID=79078 RepID=A0ABU6VI94_9FABA|nr:hypothetical protein [Stylosanthes scabra]
MQRLSRTGKLTAALKLSNTQRPNERSGSEDSEQGRSSKMQRPNEQAAELEAKRPSSDVHTEQEAAALGWWENAGRWENEDSKDEGQIEELRIEEWSNDGWWLNTGLWGFGWVCCHRAAVYCCGDGGERDTE